MRLRYHADVVLRSSRRVIGAIGIVFAIGVAAAVDVHASTVPAGTVVRVERANDTAAFAQAIDRQFHVTLRGVVAADIDRDGDLDIVASTDRGFMVWVNDGAGRLTKQSPQHAPVVQGTVPAGTWRHGQSRRDVTVQNDTPSSGAAKEYAHAPPSVSRRGLSPDRSPWCSAAPSTNASRAPPPSNP